MSNVSMLMLRKKAPKMKWAQYITYDTFLHSLIVISMQ